MRPASGALAATVLALAGAAALWPAPRGRPDTRLRRTVSPPTRSGLPAATAEEIERRRVRLRRFVLVLAALAGCAVLGPVPGAVAGGVGAVVADRMLGRLEPAAGRRRRARIVEDLPALADLLAVTIRAGVPIAQALTVCGSAVGGPLGSDVGQVATALTLGAEPERAWAPLVAQPVTAPLATAMIRAAARGLSPAAPLRSCAVQARRTRAVTAARRAQTVGVTAAAPLGLCFLPAFVLVAVVPTVVGGLSQVLGF